MIATSLFDAVEYNCQAGAWVFPSPGTEAASSIGHVLSSGASWDELRRA